MMFEVEGVEIPDHIQRALHEAQETLRIAQAAEADANALFWNWYRIELQRGHNG